jgi:hypothetical protein
MPARCVEPLTVAEAHKSSAKDRLSYGDAAEALVTYTEALLLIYLSPIKIKVAHF